MRASGNFRYDAAIGSKNIDLRNHNITQNFMTIFDDRNGGFVTRRFDSQNSHRMIIVFFIKKQNIRAFYLMVFGFLE